MRTTCHVLRMRPVWLFWRQTQFDAKPNVLRARKRCPYGVGVSTESTYVVKRVDSDFFEDEGGSNTAPDEAAK